MICPWRALTDELYLRRELRRANVCSWFSTGTIKCINDFLSPCLGRRPDTSRQDIPEQNQPERLIWSRSDASFLSWCNLCYSGGDKKCIQTNLSDACFYHDATYAIREVTKSVSKPTSLMLAFYHDATYAIREVTKSVSKPTSLMLAFYHDATYAIREVTKTCISNLGVPVGTPNLGVPLVFGAESRTRICSSQFSSKVQFIGKCASRTESWKKHLLFCLPGDTQMTRCAAYTMSCGNLQGYR